MITFRMYRTPVMNVVNDERRNTMKMKISLIALACALLLALTAFALAEEGPGGPGGPPPGM